MAKYKLKVTRVTKVGDKKSMVIAVNADELYTEKAFDKKGNELSSSAAKKLKADEVSKRRVPSGADRLSINFTTSETYKVGDELTVSF